MKFKTILFSLPFVLICFNLVAQSQKEIVCSTLILEGSGEGEIGMQSIMEVIRNRSVQYNKSEYQIVEAKYQFSCWNSGITQSKLNKAKNDINWAKACKIYQNQSKYNNTLGALFYFNPSLCNPSWVKEKIKTIQIKNHIFMK